MLPRRRLHRRRGVGTRPASSHGPVSDPCTLPARRGGVRILLVESGEFYSGLNAELGEDVSQVAVDGVATARHMPASRSHRLRTGVQPRRPGSRHRSASGDAVNVRARSNSVIGQRGPGEVVAFPPSDSRNPRRLELTILLCRQILVMQSLSGALHLDRRLPTSL
jgi:hypothetical protein